MICLCTIHARVIHNFSLFMLFDAHFMLNVKFWLSFARHFYTSFWKQTRSKWNWVRLDCQSDGTAQILSITPHSADVFSQFSMSNFCNYWIWCVSLQNFNCFYQANLQDSQNGLWDRIFNRSHRFQRVFASLQKYFWV